VREPEPTRLVLVRHGESNATVARVIAGMRTCSGLSPLGIRQAEALRDRLASTGELGVVDNLLSSTMPRALETAEVLAPAFGDLVVERVADLREHDPGEADGLTFDAYVERYGVPDPERDAYVPISPGGESLAAFHLRAATALHGIARALAGRTVVVVCHGGIVDAALRSFLGLGLVGGFELWTRNTSLTELALLPTGRWRLVRYNDSAHLAGLPDATPHPDPAHATDAGT
jgi:probable phosphoglycerate mutase